MSLEMSGRTALGVLGALLVASLTSGCGDDACNSLKGPPGFDLVFDSVSIERQESGGNPDAMIVRYVKKLKSGGEEIPAKVIANWPVEEGKQMNIMPPNGNLSRTMQNQVQFPDMESANITFDKLGGAGQEASGKFYITFVKSGGTLNGEFCGTVKLLSF